jgi:CBS domain-containing protein
MDEKPPKPGARLLVRHVMTTPVVTVRSDASFKEIVQTLLDHRVTGAPVVDDEQRMLGIVTQADLLAKEAYGSAPHRMLDLVADLVVNRDPSWRLKATGLVAGDLMTRRVVTASPDEDATVAAHRMMEARVTRLPVVEDDRVVGIVAREDLLRVFRREDAAIAGDVRTVLRDPLLTPENNAVTATVEDGVVTLDGTVPYPPDVSVLEAMVWRIPGVVALRNQVAARER